MKRFIRAEIGLFAAGMTLGAVVGAIAAASGAISVDRTINLGSAIQIFVTVVVALVVTVSLQRFASADRKEKEIILRVIDSGLDALNRVEEGVAVGGINQVRSALKALAEADATVGVLMEERNYSPKVVESARITPKLTPLRRAATEVSTRVDASGTELAEYTPRDRAFVSTQLQQVRLALLLAQMSVNSA